MNKEDKLILGTLAGVDLVLSPEHYEEYKGTLNKQLEEKNKEIDRLNKEYERIYNENCKLRENHNINDITLLDENERLNKIIEELSKDVDMWNKKYNEQFDIINELEKYIIGETELNNGALLCGLSSDTERDQYGIENNIYDNILDKLKELKENNK